MTKVDLAAYGFRPANIGDPLNPTNLGPSETPASYVVPDGMMGLFATRAHAKDLAGVIQDWPPSEMLILPCADGAIYFSRTDLGAERLDAQSFPPNVRLLQAGDVVELPGEVEGRAPVPPEALLCIPMLEIRAKLTSTPRQEPETRKISLAGYSVRGSADEFERQSVEAIALLGAVCLLGQFTLWYAPPNAGKTLIMLKLLIEAILAGRIKAYLVYYFGADDNSAGLAQKLRILDELGVHTLVPGYRGLTAAKLIEEIRKLIAEDKAHGVILLLDTVKKLASLMDKAKASEFADVCRQFVQRGGTIVGLAHTNKNPTLDGKLRYAGTTDLVDDCDAAYLITPRKLNDGSGDQIAEFSCFKRRGNNADHAAYAFSADGDISYAERLASVRLVDPDTLDAFQRQEDERSDAELVDVAKDCIVSGITAKMALTKAVAKRASISERKAVQLIERYTGNDPAQHRWTYSVQARGAKVFALLPPPATDPGHEVPPGT